MVAIVANFANANALPLRISLFRFAIAILYYEDRRDKAYSSNDDLSSNATEEKKSYVLIVCFTPASFINVFDKTPVSCYLIRLRNIKIETNKALNI